MADRENAQQNTEPSPKFGRRLKRAALFLLFGAILQIPRVRRLRRRVWAWTLIRCAEATLGGWLVWRYAHLRSGAMSFVAGVLLLFLSLVLRAKLLAKSVDAIANEFGALVVLNGGTFRTGESSEPVKEAQIFVQPETLVVQGRRERCFLEIPFATLRELQIRAIPAQNGRGPESWEVGVEWIADGVSMATFQYEGTFGRHLAEVTESTLRSQWKKGLPIIN